MLDIKFVRNNPDVVKQNIKNKFQDEKLPLVDEVIELDQKNRDIKGEVEALRAEKNKISKQIGACMAQGKKEEAEELKRKVAESAARIEELSKEEQKDNQDIDQMSGMFGKVMAEIMLYQDDEWKELLNQFGFFLGKFIYLMDAYEDIEDDLKNHNYNPLKNIYTKPEFEDMIHQILTMMMAECSKAFEQLPLIDDIDILRNVLYSGVWYRYEQVREKREKEKEEKNV